MTAPDPVPTALQPYVAWLAAYDVVGEPGIHRGLPGTSLTARTEVSARCSAGRGAPGPRAEVDRAPARLARGVPVSDVADEVGYRRRLGNLVVTETGLSPKESQRVARFEASRDQVVAAGRSRRSPRAAATPHGGGPCRVAVVRRRGHVRLADEPDALFDRAVASGATVLRPMADQDFGGRGGSVADPEGNHWS
jgi:hypothetical protein